ncbi:Hypothetical predicted protein [Podarcis lilfordi]|uniref:Uncharacterized protein n=1 Tax=Podarcis lilfordi TaxID=74358 RepID=A0AA35KDZ1_9SAUR|nr:Hypothetical predicted protein [Podarcis lilfordi]
MLEDHCFDGSPFFSLEKLERAAACRKAGGGEGGVSEEELAKYPPGSRGTKRQLACLPLSVSSGCLKNHFFAVKKVPSSFFFFLNYYSFVPGPRARSKRNLPRMPIFR